METEKEISSNYTPLFFCHWIFRYDDYHNRVVFLWRGNNILINVRTSTPNNGRDMHVYFDFYLNNRHFTYFFGHSYQGAGSKGEIPEFEQNGFRLIFKPRGMYLEIGEEPLDKSAPATVYPYQSRLPEQDSWFPIYKRSQMSSISDNHDGDDKISLWIRKVFSHEHSEGRFIYNYEVYNSNKLRMLYESGNFTCIKISDYFRKYENTYFPAIGCEIKDKSGEVLTYSFGREGLESLTIHKILGFMDSLKYFRDWKEYRSRHN